MKIFELLIVALVAAFVGLLVIWLADLVVETLPTAWLPVAVVAAIITLVCLVGVVGFVRLGRF